ncbi:MAG: D-alanine--D-alanine ligase [Pseudobacteriovorax sp.]|nr:D-alanine--D-alanine ligase [Pseudobacteriovorax sp.]
MSRIKVYVLYGGQSTEHDISRRSARYVLDHMDREKYEVHPIGISKKGKWITQNLKDLDENPSRELPIGDHSEPDREWSLFDNRDSVSEPVVVFPVLHGSRGEDGTCQGLFEMKNFAFVGPGVLGSSVSMDKVVAKILVEKAGIPVAPYQYIERFPWSGLDIQSKHKYLTDCVKTIDFPAFVKPSCSGSSVGITKVEKFDDLFKAVEYAFQFDHRVLIETGIKGREIEFAALGGSDVAITAPGEVANEETFYTYEEKYSSSSQAQIIIPAPMSDETLLRGKDLALKAFQALSLWGMARIDFFLTEHQEYIFNEANTIPGFTSISQYPQLWEHEGIAAKDLIDRLIDSAIERWRYNNALQRNI